VVIDFLDMNENILLVEDEEALRMTLGDRLRSEGYVIDYASDGLTGFQKATSRPFDLMILDILLPGRNGLDVCRDIRLSGVGTPILLLTARGTTADKIVGLKLGADDYLTKPFDMQELVARIEALLRRRSDLTRKMVFVSGSIRVNLSTLEVTRTGVRVHLSGLEFRLIRYFVQHPGVNLSRDKIFNDVWGHDGVIVSRTVDVHVAGLRQKLERDPKRPELIVTVPGFGYRFDGSLTMASEGSP
jgi:two-component system alkaline phosphatase synthesis response regulator PhoP